ncbi:MAG TPA: hypothetical protein PLQ54_17940 [Armatimonadota bacterium]|nr:hypothetical protein [Armatimonadota bacterium]
MATAALQSPTPPPALTTEGSPRYLDPRDQFIRSPQPISLTRLAGQWHQPGRRDGHSLMALYRRSKQEGWEQCRAAYHTRRKESSEAETAHAADSPAVLWARYVRYRLPQILQALVEQAEKGNLTAIKIILEAEGLTEKSGLLDAEDNYPRIVAECCLLADERLPEEQR